jgi:hypothetical protein
VRDAATPRLGTRRRDRAHHAVRRPVPRRGRLLHRGPRWPARAPAPAGTSSHPLPYHG